MGLRALWVLVIVCAASALAGATVLPSQAVAGSSADVLDVVRVGTGAAALTNASTPVSIVPLLGVGAGEGTTGTPMSLPTSASGADAPFALSGSAGSEGALNLSANGQYLILAGYDAVPGVSGVASASAATVPREVARVDGAGNVDTTTVLPSGAFSGNNVRGATSDDGTRFWVTGAGGNPRGIVYAPLGNGAAAVAVASNVTNARVPVIAGGQLYLSTNNNTPAGLYKVGTGLPTTAQTATLLVAAGGTDPYAFVFTDPSTLYVADPPGITKYSFNGTSWVPEGSASAPSQLSGLTGRVEGDVVQLYATTLSGTTVLAFTDSAASNATISGSFTTVTTAPANTVYKGIAFAPSGQVSPAPASTIQLGDTSLGGVIGDVGNPTLTATVNNDTVSVDQIQLTATSSNQSVAADSGITISGSGATRTIAVQPAGAVGYSTITLTETAPGAPATTAQFLYGASAPEPDATSHFLDGAADASTAIDVGDGYIIVGDDESNVLRLYDTSKSGGPVKTWDFTSTIGTSSIDIEAAARVGDTIYWTGSMGNNSDGSVKPARSTLFATTVTGSGASTDLTLAGVYRNLRNDLIAWDQSNGDQFGFAAGAADGQIPKEINGFNVEGLEVAPDGTAYLGFRAPLLPTADPHLALVVPVTNFASLLSGGGPATFGTPMLWDLGGLSVRELRRNADGRYLVIAGSYQEGGDEFLYSWDGNPAHQPAKLGTTLPSFLTGAWEGISSMPDPLANGASVQLLMDDGDWNYYGDDPPVESKDLPLGLQKSLIDTFTLSLPAPPAITATATSNGSAYTGGTWTNNDVTVHFSCTDASGTGIASVTADQTVSTESTGQSVTGTCADNSGATSSTTFTGIQIDKTPPTVVFSGDSAYGLLDTVSVTCTAADALSGLASSGCASPLAAGPAWSFGPGAHAVSAGATDHAGNTRAASSSFTVTVTSASLCTLTTQFVQSSAKYQKLNALSRKLVDVLVSTACNVLTNIGPKVKPAQKTQFIAAYEQAVQVLVQPGWLTQSQAATLRSFAAAL